MEHIDISELTFKEITPVPAIYYTENRQRLRDNLKNELGDNLLSGSFVLLKSHILFMNNVDDDASSNFKNEANFLYLFGQPFTDGLHGLIDIDTGKTYLVVKDLTEDDRVFHGGISTEDNPASHHVDQIITESGLLTLLKNEAKGQIFLLHGLIRNNLTSQASFEWLSSFNLNTQDLYRVLMAQRTIKSKTEIEMMREICTIAAEGHKYLMKKIRPGIPEYHTAEIFKLFCGSQGAGKLAYGTICGAGRNASILHYIWNNDTCRDGDIILLDLGVNGNGYCSDITTTFPINGKFDQKQKEIYNACYASQQE